ncbi:hypothetical protein ACFVIM_16790 [Streptomyces sp. NPDC057638]|uniref:hypothetical protein n=1 Tax=Streptomyces sp. NPDC057638 TaxID=3346190 RepID=UPI003696943E
MAHGRSARTGGRSAPHRGRSVLSGGRARLARGRELARTAADGATDVLHPLITVSRGLRLLAGDARRKWSTTPRERRGPTLLLLAAGVVAVVLVPYGPPLALVSTMGAAAWRGRVPSAARTGASQAAEDQDRRLQSLYEALVPYFTAPEDPAPLFAHGGRWTAAFSDQAFDTEGRLTDLRVRYPAYFTDGEAESRATVERLLYAKSGRGREYRFDWDEEGNELVLSVVPALSTSIAAQRFVAAPGETVLGFTDAGAVRRTVPVADGTEVKDASPVIWRTGPRSTEPHLLAVGEPGSGTTTLLRSIALQGLPHGDVLIVAGGGSAEYAALAGRVGVLAVESSAQGAWDALEWAARETERRLDALGGVRPEAEQRTRRPGEEHRPLWLLVDRPSVLGQLATADGRDDPLWLLDVVLRHGRAARVTVVVAEQFTSLDTLPDVVWAHSRARVVLGPGSPGQIRAVLGAAPHTTPAPEVPPGRGYARLGAGPVLRLQVPATPDPYDDEGGSETERRAVLELLPDHRTEGGAPLFPPKRRTPRKRPLQKTPSET